MTYRQADATGAAVNESTSSDGSILQSERHGAFRHVFLSATILAIVSLQGLAMWRRDAWYWPFINYPMYAKPWYEGDRINVYYSVYGTTADGSEVKILPEDLNLDWFLFLRRLVSPLEAGDIGKVAMFAKSYQKLYGKELIALRVEDYPLVLTWDGMKPSSSPPQVLGEVQLKPAE